MELRTFLDQTLRIAADELRARQGTDLRIDYKPDESLVTEADLASERIILDRIKLFYPEDKIYSEEAGLSSSDREAGSYIWIVDPLDGTTNYANNYPFYCVSMGRGRFMEDGKIAMVAGGIVDPCRDVVYLAELGQGSTANGRPMRVAKARDFSKCFLVTGFYYMKGDELAREIERFSKIAKSCQSIRRDGAAALDLAFAGAGVFDGFWEVGLQPWDVAAGTLIVSEAGGKVVNYANNPGEAYDIEGVGVIAGSPSTVDDLLSRI